MLTPPPTPRNTDEPRWQESAVCQTTDPEIFFPERGSTSLPAKRVCRSCPVRLPCLMDGLNDEDGVWGGLNPDDRRALVRLIAQNPRRRLELLKQAALEFHPSPSTHRTIGRTR